jgi:hypothetical protein
MWVDPNYFDGYYEGIKCWKCRTIVAVKPAVYWGELRAECERYCGCLQDIRLELRSFPSEEGGADEGSARQAVARKR